MIPSSKPPKVSRHVTVISLLLIVAFLLALLDNLLYESVEEAAHPIKYHDYVEKYAAMYEIPEEIILAVIYCESGFDASAVSHAGAVGLMQLMPDTFDWLQEKLDGKVYGIEAGTSYALSPTVRVLGSLGVNGGTAPFHSAAFSDATEEQVNLSLRVGVRMEF